MRTEHDVTLDPRMSVGIIKKIVKSFSKPYPLANLYINKNYFIKIDNVNDVDASEYPINWFNLEHGQIISFNENFFTIKVDDGIIRLFSKDSREIKNIKRVHPPTYYL